MMAFTSFAVQWSLKNSLNVTIVAMVNHHHEQQLTRQRLGHHNQQLDQQELSQKQMQDVEAKLNGKSNIIECQSFKTLQNCEIRLLSHTLVNSQVTMTLES